MKIIEKELFLHTGYPLGRLGLEKPLFLDIETTGLSSDRARVYLIGCLFPHTEECWGFRQWLTESPKEERPLLERVIAFCRDFSCLIHFNGSRFDLPFLHKRSEKLGLTDAFLTMDGLDLYQKIKACKNLCGLPNVKQKSVEEFLNIERDDRFGGGELIPVYQQFVKTGNPKLLRLLLLHNEEDVTGMLQLLPMLCYSDLLCGAFASGIPTVEEEAGAELFLRFPLDLPLPRPVSFSREGWYGIARQDSIRLKIPVHTGEYRYYFPNYKDYYYLPAEDTAVHKSVAVYVDPSFRVKAKPETCYTKKSGRFLPLPDHCPPPPGRPAFSEMREGPSYVEYQESLLTETDFWKSYLCALLQKCRK